MSKWETDDGIETDDEGNLVNFVAYGEGDDAALYSRRCECGRFVKPEPTARINDFVNEAFGNCGRCGQGELGFIGAAGDFR